ncbi:NUDIX hydrolase [Streptomyces sp. NPDC088733]|uniref:NUDIX hydrolase n=1 Tax=Streptomyces sp. NPDC088733 TaxID=3365880 RepID=UPI00380AF0F9
MTATADTPILAAGAVLWRRSPVDGGLEIALVHRPKYDDWSLPKGKLKRGETAVDGARREVKEETGLDCVLGVPLPSSMYAVDGRPKVVRYWAAEAGAGAFVPNREVDRMIWLPPVAARHRLTHERDLPVVDAFLRNPAEGQ